MARIIDEKQGDVIKLIHHRRKTGGVFGCRPAGDVPNL